MVKIRHLINSASVLQGTTYIESIGHIFEFVSVMDRGNIVYSHLFREVHYCVTVELNMQFPLLFYLKILFLK